MLIRIAGAFIVSAAIAIAVTLSAQTQVPVSGPPQAAAVGGPHPIRLRAATFTPARGERPGVRADLTIAGYAPAERGYYIVQFAGPVRDEWKNDIEAAGAEILDYIPEFAFKVRMNPGEAQRVVRLSPVVWVDVFHPAYKLPPDLARDAQARPYTVRIERGADIGRGAIAVAASGARIVSRAGAWMTVLADAPQLETIARVADVAEIEPLALRRKHNEYGGGVTLGAAAAHAQGFDGSTQTIAIADTGLGNGTTATAHADLPASRIAAMQNWPGAPTACFESIVDDGAADVDTGHGTHVATAAAGGGGTGGIGRGTAPAARLLFQAIENWAIPSWFCSFLYGLTDGYYLVGLPADIGQLFQQGYDAGARVHSNSWGSESNGAYTNDSVNADAFTWTHKQLTVVVSAGNSGTDVDGDGQVDSTSINAPASAKNVIAVGASENDRQSHYECDTSLSYGCAAPSGQNDVFTWGAAFGDRFTANPVKDDVSAGNIEQMAAFSSRGPTADGRIKPDVVAPGTWILSGYSDRFQQEYDGSPNPQSGEYQYDGWGFPYNAAYKYMGGTSMAAPLVAGGAAVVRDYYQKARSHAASAALVKATLVNAAVDLLDENNDGVHDNAYPIPNRHEGWGRVDLIGAIDPGRQFVDETRLLSTAGTATFQFAVNDTRPLKLTLAWTDYPSTTTAAQNLVNDLDLRVVAPDGTTYFGNVFSGGWSTAGGAPDRVNTLENVFVQSPSSGTWTVVVGGFNVPNGPQPFALVANGAIGGPPASLPAVTITASDPSATEAGATSGAFTIARDGDTSAALALPYTLAGTATATADYLALSGEVTIPAGAASVTLVVDPVDDSAIEGDETVVATLAGGAAYDVGYPASATVTIVSDDRPPDLIVTALTVPTTAAAGGTITVTDTTKNQGTAPSPESETGFYLSANALFESWDVFIGSRPVPVLAGNAVHSQPSTHGVPAATAPGVYYVIARADWAGQLPETQEGNNIRVSTSIRVGPDLLVSALTVPATAAAGATMTITDTTRNDGAEAAPVSVTAFYLSTNAAWDTADVRLGFRSVPSLAAVSSHVASTIVSLPSSVAAGTYYIVARADDENGAAEALENNNLRISGQVKVGADLIVSAVTGPTAAAAGGAITINETTKNQGAGAAAGSVTAFYLSSNPSHEAVDVRLGERAVAALAAGAIDAAATVLTVPSTTASGTYFVVAKSDDTGLVTESAESNNTKATATIKIGPDLLVTVVSGPSMAGAGDAITITDSIKNIGAAAAGATEAVFYLSANTTLDAADIVLARRTVAALAAGATDAASTPAVLPEGTATSSYYIIEQVDADNTVAEALETNNVSRSGLLRIGPDLTLAALTAPASAVVGETITVNDTTTNSGGGASAATTTTFYLSANTTLDASDIVLGSRSVTALAAGAASAASTAVPVPSTVTPGVYYVIAAADSGNVAGETSETNNRRVVGIRIN